MADSRKEFLIRIRPSRLEMLSDGGTAAENTLVEQHFRYLSDLGDRGIVMLAGRTLQEGSTSFGIVLLRVESEKHAQEILRGDPAVAGGVFKGELFPFRTALSGGSIAG